MVHHCHIHQRQLLPHLPQQLKDVETSEREAQKGIKYGPSRSIFNYNSKYTVIKTRWIILNVDFAQQFSN